MASSMGRVLLAVGLAVIWLTTDLSSARPAGAQPSGDVTLTTNRTTYTVGDRVRICYQVPGPGWVTLTSTRDGSSEVVWEANDDGSGDCLEGTIVPPTGRECIRLDWTSGDRRASAETCIEVREAAAPQPGGAPEGRAVAGLVDGIFLDLCFQRGTATFAAAVLDASAVRIGDATFAYILVELFNAGPQATTAALAVFLTDEQGRGGWMEEIPDEADYLARAARVDAITPFDIVPVGQSVRVLFVFRVPPGARALALAPNPVCYF